MIVNNLTFLENRNRSINLEIVPLLLTPKMKQVLEGLVSYRKNVSIVNNALFSLFEGRNTERKATESLKYFKRQVRHLKKPENLTGNGLCHQAATLPAYSHHTLNTRII